MIGPDADYVPLLLLRTRTFREIGKVHLMECVRVFLAYAKVLVWLCTFHLANKNINNIAVTKHGIVVLYI